MSKRYVLYEYVVKEFHANSEDVLLYYQHMLKFTLLCEWQLP